MTDESSSVGDDLVHIVSNNNSLLYGHQHSIENQESSIGGGGGGPQSSNLSQGTSTNAKPQLMVKIQQLLLTVCIVELGERPIYRRSFE